MSEDAFKTRLTTWLMGFAVVSSVVGLAMIPNEHTRGVGILALVFAIVEFIAIWTLKKPK